MKKSLGIITAVTLAVTGMMTGNVSAQADDSSEKIVVRANIGSEPDSLDPWLSAASDTEAIFRNVFEGLVSFNEAGELIPGLAESWEISEDGLTYTFHLRRDVVFHNGKAMTAEDVIYTYEALSGLGGEEALRSKFTVITDLEAPDDYTVIMTIKEAESAFLQETKIAVCPAGYEDQAAAPVGTGPFEFVSYTPGQKVVLEKNEAYYDESRMAKIDEAEIYIMTDDSAVLTALQSGQLDLATLYSDDAYYLNGDFEIMTFPQNMVQIFALNNDYEPLSDIRVRQAIQYAVNKEEIIEGVFSGYATELYSNFSPIMEYYYNDQLTDYYEYDVEKAKELLAEAGYADGFDLTIRVPANYQKHVDTALVLSEQLKAVNIRVTIDPIEWAAWLDEVYTNGKYEATVIGFSGKLDPADILCRFESGYAKNFVHYSSEAFDSVFAAAGVDNGEDRAADIKECQKILTEDAASVWICDPHMTVVCSNGLKGYTSYPVTFLDLSTLYYE